MTVIGSGPIQVAVLPAEVMARHFAFASDAYLERIAARRPLWTFTKYREDELGDATEALDSGRVNCLFVASGAFQGTAVEQSLRRGPLHEALGRHLERGGGLVVGHQHLAEPWELEFDRPDVRLRLVLGKPTRFAGRDLSVRSVGSHASLMVAPNELGHGPLTSFGANRPATSTLEMEALGEGITRKEIEIGPIGRVRPYRVAIERIPVLQIYVARLAVDWLGLDDLAENLIFAAATRTSSIALVKPGHRCISEACQAAFHEVVEEDSALRARMSDAFVAAFGSLLLPEEWADLPMQTLNSDAFVARLESSRSVQLHLRTPPGPLAAITFSGPPAHLRIAREAADWAVQEPSTRLAATMFAARAFAELVAATNDTITSEGAVPQVLTRAWLAEAVLPNVTRRIRKGNVDGVITATAAAARALEVAKDSTHRPGLIGWLRAEASRRPSDWELGQILAFAPDVGASAGDRRLLADRLAEQPDWRHLGAAIAAGLGDHGHANDVLTDDSSDIGQIAEVVVSVPDVADLDRLAISHAATRLREVWGRARSGSAMSEQTPLIAAALIRLEALEPLPVRFHPVGTEALDSTPGRRDRDAASIEVAHRVNAELAFELRDTQRQLAVLHREATIARQLARPLLGLVVVIEVAVAIVIGGIAFSASGIPAAVGAVGAFGAPAIAVFKLVDSYLKPALTPVTAPTPAPAEPPAGPTEA
jgi:hypothetical protein